MLFYGVIIILAVVATVAAVLTVEIETNFGPALCVFSAVGVCKILPAIALCYFISLEMRCTIFSSTAYIVCSMCNDLAS